MNDFFRTRRLPPYVFEQVNKLKAAARNSGADIVDLGMGNPDLPTPEHIVEKLIETVRKPRTHRYSASRGIPGLRRAQAAYYERRFGVKLDPEADRRHPELPVQSDGLHGGARLLPRGGGLRAQARHLRAVGPGLRRDL